MYRKKITRPLEEIKAGASRYAKGELYFKLRVPNSEEIGSLAETLNIMAVQLDERIRTISRQRQQQEAVFSAMKEGIIAVNKEERLIHINHSAIVLFGLEDKTVKGKQFQELIRNPQIYKFLNEVLEKETAFESEIIFYESGERTMHVNGTPLLDETGVAIGALLVLNDMTTQKQLENVRRDFVANVSHELKTPITLIQGFVETLLDGPEVGKADTKRFLKKTLENSKRLNAIIEDLLNLSRIEQADDDSMEMNNINLRELLDQAISSCLANAKLKNLGVDLECGPTVTVRVNRNLMEQVIVNLVDNAVKYSQSPASIKVRGYQDESSIVIAVEDFGVGIAEEHLGRLFERFYRIDKARSRRAGGTGLGLAIVKHIIQAHHGSIDVNSQVDKGTIFTIRLPK